MAGEKICLPKEMLVLAVNAACAHKGQAFINPFSQFRIAFGLSSVRDKISCPVMNSMQISHTALGKGPQQIKVDADCS